MCELYGMTSALPTHVNMSLNEFKRHGGETGHHEDGWGIAYVEGERAEIYRKAEAAARSNAMGGVLEHHKPAQMMISHIRMASVGKVSIENTQPYTMQIGGRAHVLAHNGDMYDLDKHVRLTRFQPKGTSDSEYAFCYLMEHLEELWMIGHPTLDERLEVIEREFKFLTSFGIANFIYTDCEYLYAFANKRTQSSGVVEPPALHYLNRHWIPDNEDHDIAGLGMRGDESHDQTLFATVPLSGEDWIPMKENQLMVTRLGKLVEI